MYLDTDVKKVLSLGIMSRSRGAPGTYLTMVHTEEVETHRLLYFACFTTILTMSKQDELNSRSDDDAWCKAKGPTGSQTS